MFTTSYIKFSFGNGEQLMGLTDLFNKTNTVSNMSSVNTSKLGTGSMGGGTGIGAGLVASGVISGLADIATSFINASRTKNTYKFNSRMAELQGDFNAKMSGLQGRMVRLSASVEIAQIRKDAQSLFSAQRAGYAKAGMDIREGSPVAVMLESQKNAELDAIYRQISADYNVGLTETQSDIYKINANTQEGLNKMASTSAGIDAWTGVGNTILKTGTKIMTRL